MADDSPLEEIYCRALYVGSFWPVNEGRRGRRTEIRSKKGGILSKCRPYISSCFTKSDNRRPVGGGNVRCWVF